MDGPINHATERSLECQMHVNHFSFTTYTTFWGIDETTGVAERHDSRSTRSAEGCLCTSLERPNGFHENVRMESPEAEAVIDTFAEKKESKCNQLMGCFD